MAHIPRLSIDAPLAADAGIALTEEQARHVGTVLRLDVGDGVRVFNAADGEWRARISAKSKRGMSVRVEALLRGAREVPDVELLFAPVKRHATDLIVEKATELGVRRLRPVITQRTIADTVRLDRLNTIAREAAEQTERFDAPEISEPVSLPRVLDGWDTARLLMFCDEEGDAAGLLETAQAAQASPKLALLIGPEGGFSPEERRMVRACTFVTPVSLGPRILRAETAAIAALSIMQAAWGDWRGA
jgi:16S rRNA (uracil1498-N3)-methyltransferase